MAFFDTVYRFSEVNGVVLNDGKPVANAIIEQTCSWGNESRSYQTTSDAQGRFYLPDITSKHIFLTLLPGQPSIDQKITITTGGKTYLAWLLTKGSYKKNHELITVADSKAVGNPNNIICDLTYPEDSIKGRTGIDFISSPYGICTLMQE